MSLAAAGIVLALILAVVALFGAYVVLVQYGRLLLRVEALETQREYKGPVIQGGQDATVFSEELPEAAQVSPGQVVPPFRLPALRGGDLALEEYRGREVLLVISDPECLPCRDLLPRLEEIHRRSPEPVILLVSRGDPAANEALASELGLTFPILLQRGWEIAREYGMVAAPVGYLIDANGVLATDRAVGTDAILALVEESNQQTPDQEVEVSRT